MLTKPDFPIDYGSIDAVNKHITGIFVNII